MPTRHYTPTVVCKHCSWGYVGPCNGCARQLSSLSQCGWPSHNLVNQGVKGGAWTAGVWNGQISGPEIYFCLKVPVKSLVLLVRNRIFLKFQALELQISGGGIPPIHTPPFACW